MHGETVKFTNISHLGSSAYYRLTASFKYKMSAVHLLVGVILTMNSYHFPPQHQPDFLSNGNAVFSVKYELNLSI